MSTHPVQYHAPVFRYLQQNLGIRTEAIYGSDFSVAGYLDTEFGSAFAWDTDLLSGYSNTFLSRSASGGGRTYEEVSARGAIPVLRNVQPKAVLLVGYSTRFHRGAFLASRILQIPMILRAETTDDAITRSAAKQTIRDLALRAFYSQICRLLYIGDSSLRHFRRLGCKESKLIFSPYCVDTAHLRLSSTEHQLLRRATREKLMITEDSVVLLFSGKLVYRKGADLLLTAFQKLQVDSPRICHLVFLGDGNLKSELQSRALGNAHIHFVGFRNQTELSAYYHMADMLIVPSRFGETWGLVVNEAMYHGLPCIVSDQVGSSADLIDPGNTGEIFASDSVNSLVEAIQRGLTLLTKPGFAELCRAKANKYSVESAALGIAQAYNQILDSRLAN